MSQAAFEQPLKIVQNIARANGKHNRNDDIDIIRIELMMNHILTEHDIQ